MELALCPVDRRSLLRLRLQLAAECNDGMLCRKVILAVPAGLSLVSDLMHYIYRYFKLEPIKPLAISVEGFGLLPAQRLEDVLRDGDMLWVRPAQQRSRQKGYKAQKALPAHIADTDANLPAPSSIEPRSTAHENLQNKALAEAPAEDDTSGHQWRPIGRKPLPGEVAQCVGAGMAAGVSQVTLQGSNSAVWSMPVGFLHDVRLGTALNVDPPVTPQAEQPKKEQGSAQRVCSEARSRITSVPLDKRKAEQLECAIRRQFEFYFGDVNYPKDNFLLSQADEEGWTPLRLVAKFNRVRELTIDLDLIRACLAKSNMLEFSECNTYIRRTIDEEKKKV
ncbi:unnamed protein product [Cladocopium goreaui]|uniref:Lupus La protein n=1 Tax=Cladocopium goreaui TaxID=2562237 RepID=A0A9P1M457_9DINO|nr:unnamed protein product [Cladocopium goreaui]